MPSSTHACKKPSTYTPVKSVSFFFNVETNFISNCFLSSKCGFFIKFIRKLCSYENQQCGGKCWIQTCTTILRTKCLIKFGLDRKPVVAMATQDIVYKQNQLIQQVDPRQKIYFQRTCVISSLFAWGFRPLSLTLWQIEN